MFKKLIILIFLSSALSSCTTSLGEINERAKGDGIPYIPGI